MNYKEKLSKYKDVMTSNDLVNIGIFATFQDASLARKSNLGPSFIKTDKFVYYIKSEVIKYLEAAGDDIRVFKTMRRKYTKRQMPKLAELSKVPTPPPAAVLQTDSSLFPKLNKYAWDQFIYQMEEKLTDNLVEAIIEKNQPNIDRFTLMLNTLHEIEDKRRTQK